MALGLRDRYNESSSGRITLLVRGREEHNTESTSTAFEPYFPSLDTSWVFPYSFIVNNIFQALSIPIINFINR